MREVYERARARTPVSMSGWSPAIRPSGGPVRRTVPTVVPKGAWWRKVAEGWFTSVPVWQVRVALGVLLAGSNAVGIGVAYALLFVVVPMPDVDRGQLTEWDNLALAGAYVVLAGGLGIRQAWRVLHPVVTMLRPGHEPSADDRRDVLAAPRRVFAYQATLWALGSLVFFGTNLRHSVDLALSVLFVVGLAGWTTSCLTYLFAERALRPVARRVLAQGFPNRRYVRSVAGRTLFAWALGSGVSVLGVVTVGITTVVDPRPVTSKDLAISVIVLGGIALLVGFLTIFVAARASSEPIRNLRESLARVEKGDFDVEVGIYDGTEIGMLQAGFNEMLSGLREREELRDLFGRHVGADVARRALEGGVRLGGESRDIAVLFVDIIGSTTLAEKRPPEEVVALLNRFFDVVIDVVHEHDGWINKFEGDAALAVWGAPMELEDKHTAALAAARVMSRRLAEEVPEISAGIGVSCGTAVAGNVGTHERYEYTVIGDPVNEAARLTGHAKRVPHRVVANCSLVGSASDEEARHWRELEPITVRGKSEPTPVATLRD
jgi:adenylate cyclase